MYIVEQRCITESHPNYACSSSATKNMKGNMSRNALQIPSTETGSDRTAVNHTNFFFNIVSMVAANWEHPLQV